MDSDFIAQTNMENYVLNKSSLIGKASIFEYVTKIEHNIIIIHKYGRHFGMLRYISKIFIEEKYELLLMYMKSLVL
jgi:hypothetical protein